ATRRPRTGTSPTAVTARPRRKKAPSALGQVQAGSIRSHRRTRKTTVPPKRICTASKRISPTMNRVVESTLASSRRTSQHLPPNLPLCDRLSTKKPNETTQQGGRRDHTALITYTLALLL